MPHARTQIRNAVIDRVANLPMTGARVYPGRTLPVDPERLQGPALLVFCGDEPEIERITVGDPAVEEHGLMLHVHGVAKTRVDLEDMLDQIALEVQTAMAPAGIGKDCELKSIQSGLDESLEKPCGLISLNYRITYHVMSDAPGVLI